MVQELITNQNKNAAVDLDLSGMGDKINQDIIRTIRRNKLNKIEYKQ